MAAFTGADCALPGCRQHDFLPFTCSGCASTFCLEHRMPTSHACPRPPIANHLATQCPLCGATLHWVEGAPDGADAAFAAHSASGGCKGGAPKAAKCVAHGCKTKLTVSGKVHCKACRRDVCIEHRHPDDHGCAAHLAAVAAAAKQGGMLGRWGAKPAAGGKGGATTVASPPTRAPKQSVADALKATAGRRGGGACGGCGVGGGGHAPQCAVAAGGASPKSSKGEGCVMA